MSDNRTDAPPLPADLARRLRGILAADQVTEAMAELAIIVATYLRELTARGIDPEDAVYLAAEVQRVMIGDLFGRQG